MSVIGIAISQALPVIFVAAISGSYKALVATTLAMLIVAAIIGSEKYFLVDAIFIGIGCYIGYIAIERNKKN